MSTTLVPEHMTTSPPRLCDVLTCWVDRTPAMDASHDDVSAWFELGVRLLAEITGDRSHPQHAEAVALAAEFSHNANALHRDENAEAVR